MNVTLCLTHACNLRCAYCYAGRKDTRRMAWETACRAVDFGLEHALRQAALTGLPPETQLGYFGGEPLLEWDLLCRSSDYAAQACGRLGVALKRTVTTNMTLLDEAKAEWLRANGYYVGLSLDGNAAMHDALRCFADGRGSHAACVSALAFYRGAQARAEVIVVVDPRNVAHLAESVDWLIAEDIRNIALNPNFYIAWPEPALEAWRDAYARIGARYAECLRKGNPVRINVFDGKIRVRIKEGYAACDRCGFGTDEVAVAPSGSLYPCERLVGDDADATYRIGTVFDGFDSARREAVVASRGNVVEACQACPVRDRCMNWCGCINAATTGAPNRVAGIVCYHERMAIEAADRVAATLFAERVPAFLARFYGAAGAG
jgi:uncharacterized protein